MKRNGNAFIDRSLELGEVRNGGLENLVAECLSNLGHVGLLERAGALEFGDDVTQQLDARIVVPLDSLDDCPHAGGAAGSPIGRFQGNDDKIRGTEGGIAGERHPRRTVEEDVVVFRQKLGHGIGQSGMEPLAFPLSGLRNVQSGKMPGDRDNIDVREGRLPDQIAGLGIVGWLE